MDDQSIVVLITVPSRKVGEKIAHLLLEQKLAACVNIIYLGREDKPRERDLVTR